MTSENNNNNNNNLASRVLQELNRTSAKNSTDPHFICQVMVNVTEILSSESEFPKQSNNLLSKSDFAMKCLQSRRFLELLSSHIGGDLDGWGAASTLIFTSIQALGLCLSTTAPADGRCKAAFYFYIDASSTPTSNACKVLYRLLTIASTCPSALVQQMSSSSDSNGNQNNNNENQGMSSFSLQTEGEIFAWKVAWECITGFVLAIGTKEGRKFLQQKCEEIARLKALRQAAAVYAAYLKQEESKNANFKIMMNTAKEFVENL